MATIRNHIVLRGLSGKIGSQLVLHRKHNGQYRIRTTQVDSHQLGYSKAPDSYHQRLYEALLCAPTASSVRMSHTHELPQNSDCAAIQADIIHPPEIHRIDVAKYSGQAGETISVEAGDDNKVASVGLLIVTDDGTLIEEGSAKMSDQNPYIWIYTTTATVSSQFVKILADVADLALRNEQVGAA